MSERGTPRTSHTAGFKLRVVRYAIELGNRVAGKKFAVDEICVHRWRVQRSKLTNIPKLKPANQHGVVLFPDLEKELACWIKEKRQGGFGVFGDEDPFENLDEPEPNDDELFYADTYEEVNEEDFYGF